MSKADTIYNNVIENILANGIWDKDQSVRTVWADGSPAYTKSIISQQMTFDGTEVPILTSKRVAWKTAIKELLWIWQKKSNNVQELRDMGVKIWDEWEIQSQSDDNENQWVGTIGPAYGYQMGKKVRYNYGTMADDINEPMFLDQVDNLIKELKKNPASRRHITSLWNIDDLDEMALNPCVWHTQWLVKEGKLHLIVGIRSNDMMLGNPFNVFQYYVLQRMIAQVTGYEMGTLTFNINDAHIYERHMNGAAELIKRTTFAAPTLDINPDIKNFYDFTIDDFNLIGYDHGEKLEFEIAI